MLLNINLQARNLNILFNVVVYSFEITTDLTFRRNRYAVLTYDDPETYTGPIVQGWPPSKNRSVPLYIKGN